MIGALIGALVAVVCLVFVDLSIAGQILTDPTNLLIDAVAIVGASLMGWGVYGARRSRKP